ncbi:MAG: hypothetical protein IMZ43_09895 [Thermoplasmata archaeon]|nr:hypothetical protein [Thermoplasmata archaeon]
MDTSEQYVKMCEKAEEIQKIWNHEQLRHFLDRPHSYIVDNGRSGWTWLPRQDQLQEMIKRFNPCTYPVRGLVDAFYEFVSDEQDWKKYITMEQFWLAFVMKKRYRKVWNGEEWING